VGWGEKVPGDFYNWVRSYLSGAGYDYKTVDIDALYDSSLTPPENYSAIKRTYPPQMGTKREEQLHHTTQREGREWDQREFEQGIEVRQEERKMKAKEAYEESPFKREAKGGSPDFVDEYLEPQEQKKKDFIGNIKERIEDYRTEQYRKKQLNEKGKEIAQRQKILETKKNLTHEERESRLKDMELQRRKTKMENIKRTLNPLEGYVDKPQPTPYRRAPSPTPMRTTSEGSRLAESMDVSRSMLERAEGKAATGDRYGLELRPAAGRQGGTDRYGLDLFARPGQQQYAPGQKRYKYRTIIEHGVARRERIPQVGPEGQPIQGPYPGQYPYQPQGSSLRESMDVLARPRGHQAQQSGLAQSLDVFNRPRAPVSHEIAHRAELSQPSKVKPGHSKPVQFFGKMNTAPQRVNASSGLRASSFNLPKMNFLGKPGKGRRGKPGKLGGYV